MGCMLVSAGISSCSGMRYSSSAAAALAVFDAGDQDVSVTSCGLGDDRLNGVYEADEPLAHHGRRTGDWDHQRCLRQRAQLAFAPLEAKAKRRSPSRCTLP